VCCRELWGWCWEKQSTCRAVQDWELPDDQVLLQGHNPLSYSAYINVCEQDNKDKPEDYDGGRSAEDFVTYLNEKCGTFRSSAGGLNELAGRHPDFDALAAKFFAAESGARAEIYKEATTLAKTAGAAANHYIKVMEKVANNTDAYLTKEKTR
jgi:protein disulfide-isomerase A6